MEDHTLAHVELLGRLTTLDGQIERLRTAKAEAEAEVQKRAADIEHCTKLRNQYESIVKGLDQ